MTRKAVFSFSAALFGSTAIMLSAANALPACTELGSNPAWGLAGNPLISNLTVNQIGGGSPRCEVEFTHSSRGGLAHGYADGEQQAIRIRVGLPLNSVDGGTGGVEGAWNGKTRNLGGGACVGSVGSVTSATNTGYVGSSTDSGHVGGSCLFALQPDPNTLNVGRLDDFAKTSLIWQVRWAKVIAKTYYGMAATRNYWDGCSTGGRQGLALAQKYPNELDGWLVGAPAVHYTRFRLAQMWGQLLMKDLLGGPMSSGKLNAATSAAIAACDGNDGVVDGIVDDPRTCTFSATANICGEAGAPAAPNCLTATEAEVIDKIWDGPRNTKGKRVWHGLARSAALTFMNGTNPPATGTSQIQWNHADANFDWKTLTVADYGAEAQLGSNTNGDIVNTQDPTLAEVRDNGGKILMWQGTADNLIFPENSMYYYRRVASLYGGFAGLQSWFRYFRAPGVGHCGGGAAPQPQNLFDVMVDWVENGNAPDRILASQNLGGGATRTRPLCPYPQMAIYNGSGSTDDEANFTCGGNADTPQAQALDMLAKYKFESQ